MKSNSRTFLPALVCLIGGVSILPAVVIDGVDYHAEWDPAYTYEMTQDDAFGYRFPSESLMLTDEVTGVPIIALTTSRHHNGKYYQTHPQWTPDGKYIVFPSSRGRDEEAGRRGFAYAISMETHEIVQVTTQDWGSRLHLGWHQNRAYFFHDGALKALALGRLLQDSEDGTVGEPESYLETLATLPEGLRGGGLALDANEERVYFSTRLEEDRYGIYQIDFADGAVTQLIELPIWVGHLQANPYVSGEMLYCWETRGDAPQRMWRVTVAENGTVTNEPLYPEKPTEWVTHELFIGPDLVLFNVMAHLDRLRENPTGVFEINLRTGEVVNHGQIRKGGFWHCDGTEDGRWIVADTFDGELYRIDGETGEQILLTTGHRPNSKGPFTSEAHSHHNISPDGKWVLLTSSMLTDSDLMLVPLHPWGDLRQ